MRRAASSVPFLLAIAIIALTTSVPVLGQRTTPDPGRGAELLAAGGTAGASSSRAATGDLRGTAVDASGGVLPGVTVTAATAGGQTLATTVTDGEGEFVLSRLPTGATVLTFQLSGFDEARRDAVVRAGPPPAANAPGHIRQQMNMVALAEKVTVRADPPLPPPPPRPSAEPVADHDQSAVCGPSKADAPVPAFGTIRSRSDDETKRMFASGDALLIEGGAETGLAVGQNYVVRRRFPTALRQGRNLVVMGEHSSGLLQIVDVEDAVATAVVVYACDEMMRGDYLVPFHAEAVRSPEPAGAPDFDAAARILFADAGQPLGVTGRMMILDRGARDDVRVGQRLTLFRRSRFGDRRPLVVGHGVVVAVRADSATFLVEQASDAIFFGENGDWAAPQRPARAAR